MLSIWTSLKFYCLVKSSMIFCSAQSLVWYSNRFRSVSCSRFYFFMQPSAQIKADYESNTLPLGYAGPNQCMYNVSSAQWPYIYRKIEQSVNWYWSNRKVLGKTKVQCTSSVASGTCDCANPCSLFCHSNSRTWWGRIHRKVQK